MAIGNTVNASDDVTNKNNEGIEEDKDEGKGQTTAPKRPLSPFIFYSQNARRMIK